MALAETLDETQMVPHRIGLCLMPRTKQARGGEHALLAALKALCDHRVRPAQCWVINHPTLSCRNCQKPKL